MHARGAPLSWAKLMGSPTWIGLILPRPRAQTLTRLSAPIMLTHIPPPPGGPRRAVTSAAKFDDRIAIFVTERHNLVRSALVRGRVVKWVGGDAGLDRGSHLPQVRLRPIPATRRAYRQSANRGSANRASDDRGEPHGSGTRGGSTHCCRTNSGPLRCTVSAALDLPRTRARRLASCSRTSSPPFDGPD